MGEIETKPNPEKPAVSPFWRTAGNLLLTTICFTFIIVATSGIIYLAVQKLAMDDKNTHPPLAFALVPIFGLIGGIVGAVITKENRIHLCRFRDSATLELGVVGNAITGLGGAAAVMFVFGISEFSIIPPTPGKMVVLVSITFLAGAFGPAVVQMLGKQFLDKLAAKARDAAKAETASIAADLTETKEELRSQALVQSARESIYDDLPAEALSYATRALEINPKAESAYIQKGRALSRLGRPNDALHVMDELLRLSPFHGTGIYNHACYRLLRGDPVDLVLPELKKAFEIKPELKKNAPNDKDLDRIRDRFGELGIQTGS